MGEIEYDPAEVVESGEKRLRLDLGALEYVTAWLKDFSCHRKAAQGPGRGDGFCQSCGPCAGVFDMSGFCSMFKVFDSTEAAVEKF